MGKLKNLLGQKFGRLTVIELAEKGRHGHPRRWKCSCECGAEVIVNSNSLLQGKTTSCGCRRKEGLHVTHGMKGTKIYNVWIGIKKRCGNPRCKDYKHYGGRGITLYKPWADSFIAFYEYVSQLEHFGEEGYTLDRIDSNGNYEPGNLRFADNEDVAKKSEIKRGTLSGRLKRGDTGEYLFRPTNSSTKLKKLTSDNVIKIREMHSACNYSVRELERMFNVCQQTIYRVINRETWKNI